MKRCLCIFTFECDNIFISTGIVKKIQHPSNSSSPLPRNQSSPRNSPHSPPHYCSPSHLRDEFRILNISVSSSWRDINTAYRKLARVYHPDKYDALSNVYEKFGSLEFVV